MRRDFQGAVGLNRIARFRLDYRDGRTEADHCALIGGDGVPGRMALPGCHDA